MPSAGAQCCSLLRAKCSVLVVESVIMKQLVPIGCLAGLILHGSANAQSSAPALVIQHATVIDATGAAPRRDTSILIVDGRIREIGAVRVPKGAQVIDATGKFVIPGLADMHVHTVWPQWIEQFLPLFIANGVTTVRDMFGNLELAARLRKEIDSGTRLGPRFTSPGPIVDGPKPVWPGSIAVTTAEDGRAAVLSVKDARWRLREGVFAAAAGRLLCNRRRSEKAEDAVRRAHPTHCHARGSLRQRPAHDRTSVRPASRDLERGGGAEERAPERGSESRSR